LEGQHEFNNDDTAQNSALAVFCRCNATNLTMGRDLCLRDTREIPVVDVRRSLYEYDR